MQERQYNNIGEATAFGLGSGVGWFLAIVGIAAIRERIRYSKVPAPLRGLGITFIITGLMGIAFQPRKRGATDEDAERAAERYEALLRDAGFGELRVERLELRPQVVCVLGRRPYSDT